MRKIKNLNEFPRCAALDGDGKRCRKHSGIELKYHGDGEIYHRLSDNNVTWVLVNLCVSHFIAAGGKLV